MARNVSTGTESLTCGNAVPVETFYPWKHFYVSTGPRFSCLPPAVQSPSSSWRVYRCGYVSTGPLFWANVSTSPTFARFRHPWKHLGPCRTRGNIFYVSTGTESLTRGNICPRIMFPRLPAGGAPKSKNVSTSPHKRKMFPRVPDLSRFGFFPDDVSTGTA